MKHNSALSPLDDIADAYRCVGAEYERFRVENRRQWPKPVFTLPGRLFQRLLFKIAVNVGAMGAHPQAKHWTPPGDLVRYVFGLGDLPQSGGLGFVLWNSGEPVKSFAGHNINVRLIGLPDNPNGAFIDIPMARCFVTWGEESPASAKTRAASARELMTEVKEMKHKDWNVIIRFDWSPDAILSCPKVAEAREKHAVTR